MSDELEPKPQSDESLGSVPPSGNLSPEGLATELDSTLWPAAADQNPSTNPEHPNQPEATLIQLTPTEQTDLQIQPTEASMGKKVLIPLAILGVGVASFLGARIGADNDRETSTTPTASADNVPTTTEAPVVFAPKGQDYRPKDEQIFDIEPVIVDSDSASATEVVEAIFKNLELASERRDTTYLTYYLYDRDSAHGQTLERTIKALRNYHPVTIKVSDVADVGKVDNQWHVHVTTEFDVDAPPGAFDGEPVRRHLVLVQREIWRQDDKTPGEYYPVNIWVIKEDWKIAEEFQKPLAEAFE